jgi:hygromycin-B 7''-O-kinase
MMGGEIVALTLAEWGPIFTDVEVWRPIVEEICRRHGFSAGAIRAGYPGSNAVFEIDDAFVKIAAPFWRDDVEREQVVYGLLAAQTALPTPRVLARGVITAGQEWPYFVMTKLPGERIGDLWKKLPAENRAAIASELGRMVRAIHEVRVAGAVVPRDSPALTPQPPLPITGEGELQSVFWQSWAPFVQEQVDGAVAHHGNGSLAPHLLAQLPDYLARVDLLPGPGFRPRLLHADITEDHVLLSEREGRWEITGLIDCGDAVMGDPEYEWVAVGLGAFDGDTTAMRVFLEAYGWERWDEGFRRRMLACTLLHRFSDMRPHLERLGGADRVRTLRELEALWPLAPHE